MKALVTGASGGIGQAIARALAASGAQVALSGRNRAVLTELAARLPGAVALPADLQIEGAIQSLVDRAFDALGGLDALVNCAGIVRYAEVPAITRRDLLEQLEVNFIAPLLLAQRAAELMQRGQGGAIVNVASTLALRPALGTAAYAASKAALISMTRAFALELGPHGIRVNAVAPAVIDTDMVRVVRAAPAEAIPQGADAEARIADQLEALRKLHPLGRLGTPDDVADAVLYLLDADFVTGTVLVVDGGLLLHE